MRYGQTVSVSIKLLPRPAPASCQTEEAYRIVNDDSRQLECTRMQVQVYVSSRSTFFCNVLPEYFQSTSREDNLTMTCV